VAVFPNRGRFQRDRALVGSVGDFPKVNSNAVLLGDTG
jgi:hypothetical protein